LLLAPRPVWQGADVDCDKLAQALPQLPDTADELKAIAHSLQRLPVISDYLVIRYDRQAL
jgi:hypothetical protein